MALTEGKAFKPGPQVEKVTAASHRAHEIGVKTDEEEDAQRAVLGRKIKGMAPGPENERVSLVITASHQAHEIERRLYEEDALLKLKKKVSA